MVVFLTTLDAIPFFKRTQSHGKIRPLASSIAILDLISNCKTS